MMRAMATPDPEETPAAIGRRLKITREALGLSQGVFAERAGISQNTYNQYENGKQQPRVSFAISLCKTHHMTLDWIYRGDPSGLRYDLAHAIRAIQQARASS